ncbi:MAG TPA: carboxypeptidase regulatory-like domain-containing protein [Isosphaeraceae bacterium]|jgi:thiol-disulfide isomerase/thioredoxin|nr:carboxypeptidase regulatory-like domain-containing protein [Isosphaeraceae bacterium]
MRVRASTIATPLLLAAPLLSGCASLPNRRVALLPEIQTITSVGGKTAAVVAGVPGESARSAPAPERKPRESGKVAGRVVDADGRPVPNAEVRVAVDGAAGGRIARATTDEAGGFTLAGLRPGASYRLVAEFDDGRDRLAGRAEVQAPDRDVRIELAADAAGDSPDPDRPAPRVNRASSRRVETEAEAEADDGPEDDGARRDLLPRSAVRVNEADIVPGGDVADLDADATEPKPKAPRVRVSARPKGMGWQRGDSAAADPGTAEAVASKPASSPAAPAPAAAPAGRSNADIEDDGPNPLPPAREPARAREPAPAVEPPDAQPPAGAVEPAPPTAPATDPAPVADPAPMPTPPADPPATTPPAEPPTTPAPESKSAESPATTPNPDPMPVEMVPVTPPAASKPAESGPGPGPAQGPSEPAPTDLPPPTETVRRTTWGDLPSPSDLNTVPAGREKPGTVALASARPRDPAPDAAVVRAECRYDQNRHLLTDFQLPDLDGKPVRFRDLGADLVLVDFWGTWCGPCLDAIPHLVALQERLGPGRLRVVGVAYEEGPLADRAAAVASASRRLGINYTLLLGGLDGPCPLQQALHVQAYPTLVLFDRKGHLLWRSQGNDPRTLTRLDRVLAAHRNENTIRR